MIFHDKSRSLLKMTTANGQFFAGDSQYIPKIRILLPMQVVSFKMKKVFNGLIHIQVAASIRIAKLGNTQHTHRSHRTKQFRFEVQRRALSCHTTPSELLEIFMASRDLNNQFLHLLPNNYDQCSVFISCRISQFITSQASEDSSFTSMTMTKSPKGREISSQL